MVGAIELSGRLPRGDRIGLALHQAVEVGHTDLRGEIVHLVVEQHTGFGGRDLGAEPVVQGVGHRHGVAEFVDDRVVGGVAALVRRGAGLDVFRDARLGRVDRGTNLGGVIFREQAIERVLDEVGVAERAVAIDVGMAHRLDLVVHGLRRTKAQLFQRIALEHVQDLANDHTARARRRRRDDAVAAVVAFDRLEFAGLVLVEISLREDAFAGLTRGHDRGTHRPFVEPGLALVGDGLQRLREISLDDLLAGLKGFAVVEKDRGRGRVFAKVFGRGGEHVDVALVEREAVSRVLDRRCHHHGAFHRAVFGERVFEARDRARYTDRKLPRGAQALDDVAVFVEVHVGSGGERRLFAKVEKSLAAIGELDRHETPAAEVARRGVDDRQCVADRDRRIDRVATVFEHIDTHVGRKVLRGHHHAVLSGDRGLRGGVGSVADKADRERRGER